MTPPRLAGRAGRPHGSPSRAFDRSISSPLLAGGPARRAPVAVHPTQHHPLQRRAGPPAKRRINVPLAPVPITITMALSSERSQHCPFLNRTDFRCGKHFHLEHLDHAFEFCFDRYTACSTYLERLVERRLRQDDQSHAAESALSESAPQDSAPTKSDTFEARAAQYRAVRSSATTSAKRSSRSPSAPPFASDASAKESIRRSHRDQTRNRRPRPADQRRLDLPRFRPPSHAAPSSATSKQNRQKQLCRRRRPCCINFCRSSPPSAAWLKIPFSPTAET